MSLSALPCRNQVTTQHFTLAVEAGGFFEFEACLLQGTAYIAGDAPGGKGGVWRSQTGTLLEDGDRP